MSGPVFWAEVERYLVASVCDVLFSPRVMCKRKAEEEEERVSYVSPSHSLVTKSRK